ncbi:hypothetical protein Scani_21430 [Streptomyces caniferus]|uniref:Uncharacterized protein n=1 Tax=Streptomyces caniferus TaxID=285557 RepID=A0A640S8D5_9ACTN|nr:hypothetical protein Scani_21430 [Streptomyces caniferus]
MLAFIQGSFAATEVFARKVRGYRYRLTEVSRSGGGPAPGGRRPRQLAHRRKPAAGFRAGQAERREFPGSVTARILSDTRKRGLREANRSGLSMNHSTDAECPDGVVSRDYAALISQLTAEIVAEPRPERVSGPVVLLR